MLPEIEALRAEGDALAALLRGLSAEQWQQATPFKQWTPWDVVAHLHLSDQWAMASLNSDAVFKQELAQLMQAFSGGKRLFDYTRERFQTVDGVALLEAWDQTLNALCDGLAQADPKARLKWFGPDMGVRMFATARYMETWAHAQDIYDLLDQPRVYTDSIQAIATLGVRTYGFCFANRRLEPPAPEPYVRLTSPSGTIWEWNESSEVHRVEGLASDFCHVVTQNRNVADSALRVSTTSLACLAIRL